MYEQNYENGTSHLIFENEIMALRKQHLLLLLLLLSLINILPGAGSWNVLCLGKMISAHYALVGQRNPATGSLSFTWLAP
jgi:hypothetical protein